MLIPAPNSLKKNLIKMQNDTNLAATREYYKQNDFSNRRRKSILEK